MSMVLIRAELVTLVESVVAVGAVYEYDRFAVPPETFPSVYEVSNEINIATVTWAGTRRRMNTNIEDMLIHAFALRFILQLNDPNTSGLMFQALLQSVAETIASDPTLNGTALTLLDDGDYLTMGRPVVSLFGGIQLVHEAEMLVFVKELVTR